MSSTVVHTSADCRPDRVASRRPIRPSASCLPRPVAQEHRHATTACRARLTSTVEPVVCPSRTCTPGQVCASNFCADPNDPDLVNGQIRPTAAPDAGTYDAFSPADLSSPVTGPEAGVTYDGSLDAPAGPDAPAALLDAEPRRRR